MKAFECAIELGDNNFATYYNLGNTLCRLERFKESIKAYNKALSIVSTNIDCNFNLAEAYKSLGLFDQAISQLLYVIGVDNTYLEALLSLGDI